MFDDIHSENGRNLDGHKKDRRPRPERSSEIEQPLTDREVPLAQPDTGRLLSPAVHAWLDGELPEAAVRRGDTQHDVEFWKLMAQVTETRRHMTTPAHVQQRIMDALPRNVPQLITPWWRREFVITPAAALGATGALVALTAALTALVMVLARR
ncbi:MAG TPA: hypothetical protein VH080_03210 [Gemmatimonadaceae bacterium]|jgi:hypothetical protein|nr:hypothetical protein [Gemmatimonadaceae bacterium]